jgi:hypothetical protein
VRRLWTGIALAAALALPAPALAARLTGPSTVTPGTEVTLNARGFQGSTKLELLVQPTFARGSNGVGQILHKKFGVNGRGRAQIHFTFPTSYFTCASFNSCTSTPFPSGMSVDLTAITLKGSPFRSIRHVVTTT